MITRKTTENRIKWYVVKWQKVEVRPQPEKERLNGSRNDLVRFLGGDGVSTGPWRLSRIKTEKKICHMEVFILKCNNTDIIVRLYGECTDLMIVDSECIGIMKGKVESTAVAMKWPLSSPTVGSVIARCLSSYTLKSVFSLKLQVPWSLTGICQACSWEMWDSSDGWLCSEDSPGSCLTFLELRSSIKLFLPTCLPSLPPSRRPALHSTLWFS